MRASWSFLEQQYIYIVYIYCHMISYAKVTIQSQFQVWIINFIENQQTPISVIKAIAIYHNIGKSQYKSFSASPHTQPSFSLSRLLTLTQYLWVWSFNRTQTKIGAYSFASQHTHLKGDVNNNNSCYPYSTGYMCLDLSSPHDACQRRKIKRNRRKTLTLCIKVNT